MSGLEKIKLLKQTGLICRCMRIRAGLTISDVARVTGYSEGNISQFENGLNNNLLLYLFYQELEHYEKNPKN